MIPLGYMAKKIASRPEWLGNPRVNQILSVCSCTSDDFADYVDFWKHNGFWFFDSPDVIKDLSQEHNLDLSGLRWFYYEAYEKEYDWDEGAWKSFAPEESFITNVVKPDTMRAKGYDIVNNTCGQMVECSPLSCNHLADEISVNADCLLETLEEACEIASSKVMDGCEPGPYRIVAVYEIDSPQIGKGEQVVVG